MSSGVVSTPVGEKGSCEADAWSPSDSLVNISKRCEGVISPRLFACKRADINLEAVPVAFSELWIKVTRALNEFVYASRAR